MKNNLKRYVKFVGRRWLIILPLLLIEQLAKKRAEETQDDNDMAAYQSIRIVRNVVSMAFWKADIYRTLRWIRKNIESKEDQS